MSEQETIDKALIIFQNMIDCKQDNSGLDPNRLISDLDMMSGWLLGLMKNNGSKELSDEGGLIYANYSNETIAAMVAAFSHAKLLRVMSACIFRLNQGDLSEEQFHHTLEQALDMVEQNSPDVLEYEE